MADPLSVLRNILRDGPSGLLRAISARLASAADSLDRPTPEQRAQAELYERLLSRNERFCGVLQGQRAFVLGNGPSLNSQDLDLLVGENVFAVNSFCRNPLVAKQQPIALCLADPRWFSGTASHQADLHMMNDALEATSFFVPAWAHDAVTQDKLLPPDRTFYCRMEGSLHDSPQFSFDLGHTIPGVYNVGQFAIMVALYMGCDPIYLLGMDHDWFAPSAPVKHFYTADGTDPRREPVAPSRLSNEDLLLEGFKVFRGHRHLMQLAEEHGRRILNATAGGQLDVYERADYDSLFGR